LIIVSYQASIKRARLDWNLKIGKEVEMKFLKCRKETRKKL
jgi:hypothetical protein